MASSFDINSPDVDLFSVMVASRMASIEKARNPKLPLTLADRLIRILNQYMLDKQQRAAEWIKELAPVVPRHYHRTHIHTPQEYSRKGIVTLLVVPLDFVFPRERDTVIFPVSDDFKAIISLDLFESRKRRPFGTGPPLIFPCSRCDFMDAMDTKFSDSEEEEEEKEQSFVRQKPMSWRELAEIGRKRYQECIPSDNQITGESANSQRSPHATDRRERERSQSPRSSSSDSSNSD